MASKTDIANRALIKLGQDAILLLTDDNKAARTMNYIFDTVADSEVQDNRWKFAIARTQLSALVDPPTFGYAYQYPLPPDYLGLVQVNEFYVRSFSSDRALWSIEVDNLLTDLAAPLSVRYIRRVNDANDYTPLFVEALACRLAMEACENLTQSDSKFQRVAQQYQAAVMRARSQDALENPPDELPDGSWLDSRESGARAALNSSSAIDNYFASGFEVL